MDTGLHEDVVEDTIEKPISKEKSPEELKSHTIDENLSDLEKASIMLETFSETRCIVAIKMIPDLLKENKEKCLNFLMPKFKIICFNYNHTTYFYQVISECFEMLLKMARLTAKEFNVLFIDSILAKIFKTPENEENISIVWLEIITKLMSLLPAGVVKQAIFDELFNKKFPLSHRRREFLCRVLAKCASKLDESQLRSQLVPLMIDLCNDTRYEVRGAACEELPNLCNALENDLSTQLVLPEILKLAIDESLLVKISCFQCLIDVLPLFEDENTKEKIITKIQYLIDFGINSKEEAFILKISENFGQIVRHSDNYLSNDAKSYFVNNFYRLSKDQTIYSKRSNTESKSFWSKSKFHLATCIPDIVNIVDIQLYKSKIAPCLSQLIKDKDENVRDSTASILVDVAKALGSPNFSLIVTDFCTSLSDESYKVVNTSTSKLKEFLGLFVKKSSNGILPESLIASSPQILAKLEQLEKQISQTYKYNIHVSILESFSVLPWIISTDDLVERILPILDNRINARPIPVRMASLRSMLIILRKIPRSNIRNQHYFKLLEFSTDKSCYKRIMFIEICKLVNEIYSRNFFKNWFYENLINLANDEVTNVKIALLNMLMKMKKLWNIQDKAKLNYLEKLVTNLLHDKDKDVSDLAEKAILQMELLRPYFPTSEADERADRLKEEEELFLMDLENKKLKMNGKASLNNYPTSRIQNDKTQKISKPANKITTVQSFNTLQPTSINTTNRGSKDRSSATIPNEMVQKIKSTTFRRNSLEMDCKEPLTASSRESSFISKKK